MKTLDIDNVTNLQEYVFALAAYAVSVESLYMTTQKAIKGNYLELDENEQALTILHEAKRLFHAIDGLVHIMQDRANIDAAAVAKQLKTKSMESAKKTRRLPSTKSATKSETKKKPKTTKKAKDEAA